MAPLFQKPPSTVEAVYESLVRKNEAFDNDKMGMSEVGKECDRAIWYSWRWCSEPEEFSGPKLRIFKTGHVHEDMILDDLEAGGLVVSRADPDTPISSKTGKHGQWEVRGLDGHLKGKLDARIWNVPEAPKTEHVGEVKTHNDKSWKKVVKEGVEKAKPEHFAQMQLYMHFRGLTRALYIAENKNTSELHTERVEYDMAFCLRLLARLESIRDSRRPPTKLHEDPTAKSAFSCGWCKAKEQCHFSAFARNNCRTCLHSTPVSDGKWHCARWDRELTYLEQREGCGAHLFIPELVPGEQVDCDPEGETVTYILESGGQYVDGGDRHEEPAPPTAPSKKEIVAPITVRYWHHPESSSLWTTNGEDPRESGGGDAMLVEELERMEYEALERTYADPRPVCDYCAGVGKKLRTMMPECAINDCVEANDLTVAEYDLCEECGGTGKREE